MLFITAAGSLVEPEPDVVLVYKIYGLSDNRTNAEMLVHTHRPLATPIRAITLTYRSLRGNRSSIHTDWGKTVRMVVRVFFGM